MRWTAASASLALALLALPANAGAQSPCAEYSPPDQVEQCEALEREGVEQETREAAEKEAEQQATEARERHEARLAQEWAVKPTVTLKIAKFGAERDMRHSEFPIWRVDCRGGRIDRTHWSCRVAIFYRCLRTRILIYGAGYRNGNPWFGTVPGHLTQCRP